MGVGGKMYDELVKRLRSAESNYQETLDCLYEAADVIEAISKTEKTTRWIPVTERLPENGVHVLLSCNRGSCAYVCDGFHTEKYSMPTLFFDDIVADYDEDTDEYYFPEGWWEVIKNWDDYSCVAIEDTVTHWMPLPKPPKEEQFGKAEPLKQEYYHAFCSRCGRPVIAKKEEAFWWPGGTTDDHLCISCDVCGGLAEV